MINKVDFGRTPFQTPDCTANRIAPSVLTTGQFAAKMQCDPQTVRTWIAAKIVDAQWTGKQFVIPHREVERFFGLRLRSE